MSPEPQSPLASCIIAVYNGHAYLRQAIDSLLAQQYPRVEIVVVNDGSTDGTADVIREYGDRIRSAHQANCGVSAARNRGVEMSSGALLCFLDADDLLETQKIAVQAAAFAAEPSLEFCDCHSDHFWTPDLSQEARQRDARYSQLFWRGTLPRHISTWLFRRELWVRVGGFQPGMRYAEDLDWLSRARDLSLRTRTLPEVLTHRRLHAGNVSARCPQEQSASLAGMLSAHLQRKRNGRTA